MEYERGSDRVFRDTNITSGWIMLAALFGGLMLAALI